MRALVLIRKATAQANTGQTDLVNVPEWARQAVVFLRVSAVAGTTPLTDMKFQYEFPDGTNVDFAWNGITQIVGTTAGAVVVSIGSGIGTEDDTGPVYQLTDILPNKFNIVLTFDRTTGDETYTYRLDILYLD